MATLDRTGEQALEGAQRVVALCLLAYRSEAVVHRQMRNPTGGIATMPPTMQIARVAIGFSSALAGVVTSVKLMKQITPMLYAPPAELSQ